MAEALRAVIITGPGFEDPEVIYPAFRLQEEDIAVDIVTSTDKEVRGKYGYPAAPTKPVNDLRASDFDAVIVPGGYEAPDRVRQSQPVLGFLRDMAAGGKVISCTCHGAWVLISAGVVKGRNMTCYVGIRDDLINAGAIYHEQPLVVDGNFVTSDHLRNSAAWMKATVRLIKAR